jgi:hypothetical protein
MKNVIISYLAYYNYMVNFIIVIMWLYLYYIGSLTIDRIIIFIIVFLIIYGYSRFAVVLKYIILNPKVIKYVKNNSEVFLKIVYVLLELYR